MVATDDSSAFASALRDMHTLVHLAGRAHVMREPDGNAAARFHDANVELTRRAVQGATVAGVSRVIFLSSIGAVATTAQADVTDATTASPDTPYGRSKLDAEVLVRTVCEQEGLSYVILRPPMVYGPGMKGNPLRLFRAIDRGIPLPVAGATNRRSMMYVDNLVAAIVAALRLPLGTRQTFVVGDSEAVSTTALVHEIAGVLKRPTRLVPIPLGVMRAAGAVGDAIDRVVPFSLTSTAVDRLFGSLAVDASRFAQVARYVPPVNRHDAMQRTAEWFRQAER